MCKIFTIQTIVHRRFYNPVIFIMSLFYFIWNRFREEGPSIENESRFNRYNVRTVNTINFLFSTLYTIPFLYGKQYFGVLHEYSADVTKSYTPWGSKPSHLQEESFKSLQIRCERREVLSILNYSVS